MARPDDTTPIRSYITDVGREGFLYSVRPYTTHVWKQQRQSCAAYTYTDLVTVIHKMKTGNSHLRLSPNALLAKVTEKGLSHNNSIDVVSNFGLEEHDGSEINENIPNFEYRTEAHERYYVNKFLLKSGDATIIHFLKINFGPEGKGYPVAVSLKAMEIEAVYEDLALTTREEPYSWDKNNRAEQFWIGNTLRDGINLHTVLVTGIYARKDNPLPWDYSIEFKNTDGDYWGDQGFGWVTVDTLELIAIPLDDD